MEHQHIRTKMKTMMLDAYQNPGVRNCFYSADNAEIKSERLNQLPFWDWTPEKALQVEGNSTCIFPLALGCNPAMTSEGNEWADALFDENTIMSASEFPVPNQDIWQNRTGELLRNMQAMLPELGENEVIRAPDIQSPLGIAEIVCGSALYMALMVNPEPVHALLQTITDFEIEFIQEMKKITGEKLNGTQFPMIWNNHEGTLCSDDAITLLSPEMHLEFSVPYINQIAEACGPLFYHSCTWYEKYFDNIKQVKNVRVYNWNPGSPIDPKIIIDQFSGRAVLAPHLYPDMYQHPDVREWGHFSDDVDMFKYFLDCMNDNTSMNIALAAEFYETNVLEKIYDVLNERGLTPEARGLI